MKRQEFAIVALAAMFGLASPAASWAQRPGGTPVGTAEPRGGGGGGDSSGGGSAAPRSGGGDGGSSSGSSSGGASSLLDPERAVHESVVHPARARRRNRCPYAPQRRGGGGSGGGSNGGGGQAVPRGGSSGGGEGARGAHARRRARPAPSAGVERQQWRPTAPFRPYSRPRGDHPVTGEAVPRPVQAATVRGGSGYIVPYYPYGYYPYGLLSVLWWLTGARATATGSATCTTRSGARSAMAGMATAAPMVTAARTTAATTGRTVRRLRPHDRATPDRCA